MLQVADWRPKLESTLSWFGQLQDVDVQDVPVAIRSDASAVNFLRPDTPRVYEHR